ncbi:hypothetical protein CEXT_596961 [Caerostris extrusa]|uniref:Uncharacterized protein n=1 Tax=Caerostris extrusa TaxID=172846 RepID=A0AAV4UI08_CAEEX|nr:hypothetical protein CEXT_596961 [Caerostris extrusa]
MANVFQGRKIIIQIHRIADFHFKLIKNQLQISCQVLKKETLQALQLFALFISNLGHSFVGNMKTLRRKADANECKNHLPSTHSQERYWEGNCH